MFYYSIPLCVIYVKQNNNFFSYKIKHQTTISIIHGVIMQKNVMSVFIFVYIILI